MDEPEKTAAEGQAAQPTTEAPPFTTLAGATQQAGTPTPGLSQSPGLRELPNSQVPGLAGGGMISHVAGPGQAPVDPVAAGLDMGYDPLTRSEDRMISQTGTIGAGQRPSTYVEKGGVAVPQAGVSDHSIVAAPRDKPQAATPPAAATSPEPTQTPQPTPQPTPAPVKRG